METFHHISLLTLDSMMKCLFGYTSNCQNERLETEVSLIVLFSHKKTPKGGGLRNRSLPMYVFAIVAQRSPSYVAVSVHHSNSRHLFKF